MNIPSQIADLEARNQRLQEENKMLSHRIQTLLDDKAALEKKIKELTTTYVVSIEKEEG